MLPSVLEADGIRIRLETEYPFKNKAKYYIDCERDFDFVVKNPGLNYHKPFILRLQERNVPVQTQIELGYQFAKPQNYIAVTGTNGKTTTVTLINDILKDAGRNVHLAGNVGTPYCQIVLENNLLNEGDHDVVLEMSNFQLLNIEKFKSNVVIGG